MLTDEQLVEEYRRTCQTACLEELLGRHLLRVRSLIFQVVLNDDDADDLTQETMVKAIRGVAAFRNHSKFGTWICQIGLNAARSYLSQNSVRLKTKEAARSLLTRQLNESGPEKSALAIELDERIEIALASLTDPLRAAVVLVILQGFTPWEAAAMEGCSIATFYWRLHRARKLLKSLLGDYLEQ